MIQQIHVFVLVNPIDDRTSAIKALTRNQIRFPSSVLLASMRVEAAGGSDNKVFVMAWK